MAEPTWTRSSVSLGSMSKCFFPPPFLRPFPTYSVLWVPRKKMLSLEAESVELPYGTLPAPSLVPLCYYKGVCLRSTLIPYSENQANKKPGPSESELEAPAWKPCRALGGLPLPQDSCHLSISLPLRVLLALYCSHWVMRPSLC